MPRLAQPSLLEHDFLVEALQKHSLRVDGRGLLDPRQIEVSYGSTYGSATVHLSLDDGPSSSVASTGKGKASNDGPHRRGKSTGRTTVSVQVSAEIVRPREERPFEGFVVVRSEISPLAGSNYEASGRPSEEEVLTSRALEKAIRRSEVVDRESLCILAGQKVWQIRLDVHFLNDEGNMLDCASIACMAALLHFRKPEITVQGTDVTVHSVEERVPMPLSLHHSPYCITFALFGRTTILDPSLLETQLCTGILTLTLNAQNEICVFNKAGGEALSVEEIMRIVGIAKKRVAEIDSTVRAALKKAEAGMAAQMGY